MTYHAVTERDELAACYEDYFLSNCKTKPDADDRRMIRKAAYTSADFVQTSRSHKPRIETALNHLRKSGYNLKTSRLMAQAVNAIGRDYTAYSFDD